MTKKTDSSLVQANKAFHAGDYADAVEYYVQIMINSPTLAKHVVINLVSARNRYRAERKGVERQSVAVCGWELSHNAAGRAYTLAMLYETFADVELIGSLFPKWGGKVWEPISETTIAKHMLVVEDESCFIEQAIKMVAAHPYDVVHLSKPRAPNIFFGILYKQIWDAKVLIDIDDEELAFVGEETTLSIENYIEQHSLFPELRNLAGKDWTRIAVGLVKDFDGITVANSTLQQVYGGHVVCHARNENHHQKLSPSRKRALKAKFGIALDKKIILFLGTPRKFKGLIETAKAISSLKRQDIVYVIVGTFQDSSLKEELQSVSGVDYVFIRNQPIAALSEITAIGDVCVLMQDLDSIAAQHQSPAKLTDALAVGVPVLASKTLALADAFFSQALLPVTSETLAGELVKILDDPAAAQSLGKVGYEYFHRELSFAVNIPRLRQCLVKEQDAKVVQKFRVHEKCIKEYLLKIMVNIPTRLRVTQTNTSMVQGFDDNKSVLISRKPSNKSALNGIVELTGVAGEKFSGFGVVDHYPLISIIIVSFNSGKDLVKLFSSLVEQTYSNFELILLENGLENTEVLCQEFFNGYKYIRLDNVGFAQGNNEAAKYAKGEFIALVNPDTILDKDCIREMVDNIRQDENTAIVAPKIYFYEKFVRLTLNSDHEFSFDLDSLLSQLDYKKFFLRVGELKERNIFSKHKQTVIDIAHGVIGGLVNINIYSQKKMTYVKAGLGYSEDIFISKPSSNINVDLRFSEKTLSSARYIVNNAGSGIHETGQTYDVGFGEYDDGRFFSKTYLSAFCGCVALIRVSAVLDRKIFISELFAYYEDSELSNWITNKNYRILYCPSAVVFHKHSESTQEKSITWNALVGRSNKIYKWVCGFSDSFEPTTYNDKLDVVLKEKLEKYDESISLVENKSLLYSLGQTKTLCIYNSYFNSKGGGEKHALDFAERLQDKYDVYLVSEKDFDMNALSNYFNVDLSKCRKLICTRVDTYFSSKFNVFINSTYRSNLVPASNTDAYYIVSFPHKDMLSTLKKKYTFLHNSKFTKSWALRYWGKHRSKIILPILDRSNADQYKPVPAIGIEKVILSVGRFTSGGHCKNHHYIAEAFKLAKKNGLGREWRLVIVGSCDFNNKIALDYYNMLQTISQKCDISINANVSYDQLLHFFNSASIYVHAAGLGVDRDKPDLHEHFGITVHEAMKNKCFPIVYGVGGPAEQVEGLEFSSIFSDLNGLQEEILNVSKLLEGKKVDLTSIMMHAQRAYEVNDRNFDFFDDL